MQEIHCPFSPAIIHDLAYLKQRCNNVIIYKGCRKHKARLLVRIKDIIELKFWFHVGVEVAKVLSDQMHLPIGLEPSGLSISLFFV